MSLITLELLNEIAEKSIRESNQNAKQMPLFLSQNKKLTALSEPENGLKTNKYAVLVLDFKEASKYAHTNGAHKTLRVFKILSDVLSPIISRYGGQVITYSGSRTIITFHENSLGDYIKKSTLIKTKEDASMLCGIAIMHALNEIINPLFTNNNLMPVKYGIGIDTGDLVIIGSPLSHGIVYNAFGTCLDNAIYIANGLGEVKLANEVFPFLSETAHLSGPRRSYYYCDLKGTEALVLRF